MKFAKAKELKMKYIDMMANAMLTFTPLVESSDISFLTRNVSKLSGKDSNRLYKLKKAILAELEKRYNDDLNTEQKYVNSKDDIAKYMHYYSIVINGADEYGGEILPKGRARNLYGDNNPSSIKKAQDKLKKNTYLQGGAINPDGTMVICHDDVSFKTNVKLNFENVNKPSRPFAFEAVNRIISY